METGWETAFEEVTGSKRFAQSMMRLYEAEGRVWPALFLNATWSENGRRLVASNIRLTNPIFPLAIDQLDTLQRDLRLSTAAHNSARFPAISPPGSWSVEGKKRGHLVDGGYFENFGAETALTILQRADQLLSNIHPVVILISSDPSLPESLAIPPQRPPIRFAHEIRGILTAFLRARDARGAEAASRLKKWADAPGRSFAYFRMCGIEENQGDIGQTGPPLGWALSETARDVINAYLPAGAKDAMCGNQESYRTIIEAFAGSGT